MRCTRRTRITLAAAALLAACGRTPTEPAADPLAAVCARLATELARMPAQSFDEGQALERLIPGRFVGSASSPAGNAIVLMEPDSLAAAKATAGYALECPGADRFTSFGFIGSAVVAVQGRHPYTTLRGWLVALRVAVGPALGSHFSGIDAAEGRVTFAVEDVAVANQLAAQALRIGIPPGALRVDVVDFWWDRAVADGGSR